MPIDVDAVQRATPGSEGVAHLNNAGASLATNATLDTITGHLKLEAALGGYEAAAMVTRSIESGRSAVAQLVNASPDEIAYTTSDGHAFTKAFWGLVVGGWFRRGDVVAVDQLSYSSHHLALLQAKKFVGIDIVVVPAHTDIPANARAVAYTLIGTHSGAVNDLDGVAELTRARSIPFFVDACQAVGQRRVDVEQIGCDVLTTTGRKWLRGPRGTGFLYVRKDWIDHFEPVGIDGDSANWLSADEYELSTTALRFEEFETSLATRLGLCSAVEQLLALGIDDIETRVVELSNRLRRDLDRIGGVILHDGDGEKCGIVTFNVLGVDPLAIVESAASRGVNINTSTAQFARLDMDPKGLSRVIRASPHYYNDEDEIDLLVDAVRRGRDAPSR